GCPSVALQWLANVHVNGESSVTKLGNPESSRLFEPITDQACEWGLNPSRSESNIASANFKKDH
ncbi:MAG TPA: hypothetical protein VLK33_01575, partial [Terriglobales bacterium]|nr:hypothetical protein [Terriglobales bacterium]